MGIRETLAERSQPFLEPGEKVRHAFPAQTASPFLILVPMIFLFLNRYRIVLVTDRAIVVLNGTRFQMAKPVSLHKRLPRTSRFGKISGVLYARLNIDGDRLWVHKRFHGDAEAADEELGASL